MYSYAKVPIVMQLENVECGAACIAMILAYYGKWIPLEQVREDCGISRDGCSLTNMIHAAKRYGFDVHSYSCNLEHIVKRVQYPCIIHWNFNHFVVLKGFTRKGAVINDPALGKLTVTMEEFSSSFTGVYMTFGKTQQFLAGGKRQSLFPFVRKKIRNANQAIIYTLMASMISCLIGILYPVLSRIFADNILSKENPGWLRELLFIMGILLFAQIITSILNGVNMLKVQGKLAIDADYSFIRHLLKLPMSFYSMHMAGDMAVRQDSNRNIAYTLVHSLAPSVLNIILLAAYFAIMMQYSVALSILSIAMICINTFCARIISKKRIDISRVQVRNSGQLMSKTINGMQMIEAIKANGSEEAYFKIWTGQQVAVNNSYILIDHLNITWGMLPQLVERIGNIWILILGAYYIMKGQFTIGMLLAFQGFLVEFIKPIHSLILAGQSIGEMRTSMERIEDVMKTQEDPLVEEIHIKNKNIDYKMLEMRHVSFRYAKFSNNVIHDISLRIPQGKKVAIVGESGSGKTTLLKLLSGLYHPVAGEIIYTDKSGNRRKIQELKKYMAVVDQNIVLFEDTIENNIKLWDLSVPDSVMYRAAKDAQIHDLILNQEDGYQSVLIENGKNLSGGQRQCLEIARVLAKNPQLIIFDEATSALDAETEHQVIQAISKRAVTLIIISHRLSIIRDCDEIIVMDNGNILERGTHQELYNKVERYNKLVTTE